MSKSKRNVVDPVDIIASYGADTARFFMLSDSPPERDVEWTEAGVDGAHRFVQRVWRLLSSASAGLSAIEAAAGKTGKALDVSRMAHKTLKLVGEDLDRLGFNKAVARLYEMVNELSAPLNELSEGKADAELASAIKQACEFLVCMFAPMMPHLAEECWKAIGGKDMVAEAAWPQFNPDLVRDDEITLPVQVNGKKRGEVTIDANATQEQIIAATLQLDVVQTYLDGKEPRKVIVVPKRIVNIVV